jgi:hypothetical protein
MSEPPFGTDPDAETESELEAAEKTERALNEQLEALIAARSRAESEARRLHVHASKPDADLGLAELVRRYESQSAVLTSEISILRASLRGAEARLQKLRGQAG